MIETEINFTGKKYKSSITEIPHNIVLKILNIDTIYTSDINLDTIEAKEFHNIVYGASDVDIKIAFAKVLISELNKTTPRGGKRWMRIFNKLYKLYITTFVTQREIEKTKLINNFLESTDEN